MTRLPIGETMAIWSALAFVALPGPVAAQGTDAEGLEFFEKKVRPVLVEHCYKCHSSLSQKLKGGLLLDSRAGFVKGGDTGPALAPGQPEKSRFIEAVNYNNIDLRMPPRGKLPDAVIADLTSWVRKGAPWPSGEGSKAAAREEFNLKKRKREHWAWQPIRPQYPPAVKDRAWPRTPIDAFIQARLEEKDLHHAGPADRRTLIRRVYFDLIGLPPKPADVEAFANDMSVNAFDKVVDRLLASEHFGERWARHWLDLVRYAESKGHEFDHTAPNAYQYRDYVIRAFNADVPYDHFVIEHLAGDLLEKPRQHPGDGFNESILGTGFWFLGEEVHSPVDIRQDQADRFDNRIDVMSKTFLGLTLACARCHDHKFDAISTRDYYSFFGFLESSSYRLARFETMTRDRLIAKDLSILRDRGRPPIQRALAQALKPGVNHLADYLLASMAQESPRDATRGLYNIDPAIVNKWSAYLRTAVKDNRDPLQTWAIVAAEREAGDPKRLAEVLRPIMNGSRKSEADARSALQGAEVVIDFRTGDVRDWMPDGVAFGAGPVRPGQVRFSDDPTRPILKVFDYAAAEKDPTWNVVRPAGGAETDPGALGSQMRAGRTIRTPTFTVAGGKIYYLVKGTGRAYAAVDQHTLIAGPLHARLIQALKAGDHFQWISHDLTPYRGQRVHVEFNLTDQSDFAVAMVVQADTTPGAIERPNSLLLRILEEQGGSVESLAAGYQGVLLDTLERLASDRIAGSAGAADYARIANWLIEHEDLLVTDQAAKKRLAEVVYPFFAEEAQLLARIKPESRLAMAMLDGTGLDEHVFIRGSPKAPGEVVPRRFLEALAGASPLPVARGSGRLELARQLIDPAIDPFLSRVMVNRVWHHLFGRGIVPSVDNFGVLGEKPTHPELLDYLATRFIQEGWSVKKLIRELVLSSTYRMSSSPEAGSGQADPQNMLWHRMRLRRLEGEAIRDAMLAVSGRLNEQLYGPPVPVFLTAFQEGRGRPASGPLDGNSRRSIYLAVRRNFLSSLLLAFDTPIPFSTVGRRSLSNVPAQALILMNDPFVHQQAEAWAGQVLAKQIGLKERVTDMYQSAFGRPPSEMEIKACREFLERQTRVSGAGRQLNTDDPAAWKDLAHVLFNAKEFIFID